MLGSEVNMSFVQDEKGLTINPNQAVLPLPGIANPSLAAAFRVFRITHDKGWINDDDSGAVAPGWFRYSNLGKGDYNNDLTISNTPGDVWSISFTGNRVSVIAPRDAGAGKMEIEIDGQIPAIVDLSISGSRKAQQVVYEVKSLTPGNHIIEIINRGSGPVCIDAIIAGR